MGDAIATGTDYYSLSYTPPDIRYDGKHHTIEVKTDRPGRSPPNIARDTPPSISPRTPS